MGDVALEVLFRRREINLPLIAERLHKLSKLVMRSIRIDSQLRRDVEHGVWLKMWKCVPGFQFDPRRAGKRGARAEDYFYVVGLRAAWGLARGATGEGANLQPLPAERGGGTMKHARDCQPVRDLTLRARVSKKHAAGTLRLLDRHLRKCRDEIRQADYNAANYEFLAAGISFLQEFRRALVGSYKPMDLRHTHYTADRSVSKARES